MATKSKSHNPLIILLFIVGLGAEIAGTTIVGHDVLLNTGVVLLTALFFYSLDDIADLIMLPFQKGKKR